MNKTLVIDNIPIEIVNNTDIVEIFGGHKFSDIKRELFIGCGVMARTIEAHEVKHLEERYKNNKPVNLQYMIIADEQFIDTLTVSEFKSVIQHELGHIHLKHLDQGNDDYSLQEEIDADNYAVSKGSCPKVLIDALATLIKTMLKIRFRTSNITESDVLIYRGYKERLANLQSKINPVSKAI